MNERWWTVYAEAAVEGEPQTWHVTRIARALSDCSPVIAVRSTVCDVTMSVDAPTLPTASYTAVLLLDRAFRDADLSHFQLVRLDVADETLADSCAATP